MRGSFQLEVEDPTKVGQDYYCPLREHLEHITDVERGSLLSQSSEPSTWLHRVQHVKPDEGLRGGVVLVYVYGFVTLLYRT